MDDSVKQAMAKWPNVPHCYGWLALDARGCWRMRDDRAQALGLAGDKVLQPALLGFINRNYACDDQGRWYFQNGPQRVYVNLEATPYIARTDPMQGFILQTGEPVFVIDAAWMTDTGSLLIQSGAKIAKVDDRDIAECIANLRINDAPVNDDQLLAWLQEPGSSAGQLHLAQPSRQVPVQFINSSELPAHFGFVRIPQPDKE